VSAFTWDRAASIEAADMWRAGNSASLIAARLETSRSSVVARLHRMGVRREGQAPLRPSPAKLKPRQPTPARRDESLWLAFDELRIRACRFPKGEGKDLRFCGAAAEWPSPYCPTHKEICCPKREPRR
jgi:hypothetical protein